MKKILIAIISLMLVVACSSATASEDKQTATYIESVDKYNTFEAIKIVDKESGCKYLMTNSGSYKQSLVQMLDRDGKPLCK